MSRPEAAFTDLLARAREGDAMARRLLFERVAREDAEGALLVAMARKILPQSDRARDFVESQDLIQSALRSGLLDLQDFRGDSPRQFLRWIHSILVNKLRRVVRKRQPRPGTPSDEGDEPDPGKESHGPLGEAIREEVSNRVRTAIEALPAEQRTILQLRLQGLNGPAIAEKLGLTPETVRKRESRAAMTLRSTLKEYGSDGLDLPRE